MSRYFQAGAKAKAALAERKTKEPKAKAPRSDNDSYIDLPRPIGTRPVREWRIVHNAKLGKHLCEHCLWRAPDSSLLHAHHVVPLACGGDDAVENLIVLCPTCHALAHYVTSRSNYQRRYSGPRTALELRRWIAHAKHPSKLRELQQAHHHAHLAPILSALRA